MKKTIRVLVIVALMTMTGGEVSAQISIPIIGQLVAKVLQAIDLVVQRVQLKTIGLQEAQKELENTMSALRLEEIRDWVQQQKDLYADYFQELYKVKTILSDYHKVSEIVNRQEAIVSEYKRAVGLFRQDSHFSAAELAQMESVLSGIVAESGKNLDLLMTVIESFTMQMSDQKRMEMIDQAGKGMDKSYGDLKRFTDQSELLSLQRSADVNEYEFLKKMYGL